MYNSPFLSWRYINVSYHSNMLKIQSIIILLSIAYFSKVDAGLSALYGGLISFVNTALVNRHVNKQKKDIVISANTVILMMIASVIIRMTMVAGLILIGYFMFELNAGALTVSLVLGIFGFLIDQALQK